MKELTTQNQDIILAIVGVVGTLLGTVLGWFLSELSNFGFVKIYVSDTYFKSTYYKEDKKARMLTRLFFAFSLDVVNRSKNTRFLRDIKVRFIKKGKIVLETGAVVFTEEDLQAKYGENNAFEFFNISGNSTQRLKLLVNMFENYGFNEQLLEINKIQFVYKNEKNRTIKKSIKNIHFEPLMKIREECFNGQAENGD